MTKKPVFEHWSSVIWPESSWPPPSEALWDRKVFDLFQRSLTWVTSIKVVEHTHGNRGYLRVALRLLLSAGWLEEQTNNGGLTDPTR